MKVGVCLGVGLLIALEAMTEIGLVRFDSTTNNSIHILISIYLYYVINFRFNEAIKRF